MMDSSSTTLGPGGDPYAVEFAPRASMTLMSVPASAAARVWRRVDEIAEVAATLASPAADLVTALLRLRIDDYLVSYTISDARRLLTVLDVVSLAPSPSTSSASPAAGTSTPRGR